MEKEFQFLKLSVQEGIATITLNRPEVYNALNDELTYEIQDALNICTRDNQIRVVVLTGEGKAFCSGQDLKSSADIENKSFADSLHKRYNPIIRAMRKMPKPVIAKVNGVAAGAGCSLALASDYIIAAEEATLIEVFINIGLVPDSGSSLFLPRLVGYTKAFELATMGTRIKATQAFEMGIVNKVVPLVELDKATEEITSYYANAPTKSIGLIKKMLEKAYTSDLDQALDYEAYCQEIAGRSDDYKEGVNAFLEKRKPEFKGN
ncbi:MAG: enoyl-CoA hydratase-related protein [Bacteroidetes bacterium]|nr:enoyl-CoA hydratase-related protein [Bacteroidota bacterium]